MKDDAYINTGINPASLKVHCRRILSQALGTDRTKGRGHFGTYIELHYLPGSREREHPQKIESYGYDAAGVLELAMQELTGGEMIFRAYAMFDWAKPDHPCVFQLGINPVVHDSNAAKYDRYKDQGIDEFLSQNKKRLEEEIDKVIAKNFKTQKAVQ